MKARISISGNLEVERNGKFVLQSCPWSYVASVVTESLSYRNCGDWCPLFEERGSAFEDSNPKVKLCCAGRIVTHEITEDAR